MDYIDNFREVFENSKWYNFPCFPSTVPDLKEGIQNDSAADPAVKYKILGNVLDWATNVGYPGYATAAIDEAFRTWVIPTMFAKVARGDRHPITPKPGVMGTPQDETAEKCRQSGRTGIQTNLRKMEIDFFRGSNGRR